MWDFYEGTKLLAVLDLICGWPESDDAFIGWFMVEGSCQGRGIGSAVFADIRAAMKGQGYDYLSLKCEKAHPEAIRFWEAQGFAPSEDLGDSLMMARSI